jgi:hypothetical protein
MARAGARARHRLGGGRRGARRTRCRMCAFRAGFSPRSLVFAVGETCADAEERRRRPTGGLWGLLGGVAGGGGWGLARRLRSLTDRCRSPRPGAASELRCVSSCAPAAGPRRRCRLRSGWSSDRPVEHDRRHRSHRRGARPRRLASPRMTALAVPTTPASSTARIRQHIAHLARRLGPLLEVLSRAPASRPARFACETCGASDRSGGKLKGGSS